MRFPAYYLVPVSHAIATVHKT